MKISILGGGLAGISAAYFLQNNPEIKQIDIFEKEEVLGGLCRSFNINGIFYDIGPHIIFSKDQEILDLMNNLLEDNKEKIKRSNKIIHNKKFIQYPFENDLSKLPQNDLDYCLNGFLNNPYEDYKAKNMLQFFLKTFGEGITNIYLRPYNEKIWKFDPAFMDTQMVDRIPKPPKEDILKSASGETVEGYTHQLYFTYPKTGAIEAVIKSFVKCFNEKINIYTGSEITGLSKNNEKFTVETTKGKYIADKVISGIPANILAKIYKNTDHKIFEAARNLKYNSIIIAVINTKTDMAKDNFAFMTADKKVIFHRVSKLDFLGKAYHKENSTTYMAEITYRKGDLIDKANDSTILEKITEGMQEIGFIESQEDINFSDIKRFEYAYVIYDLEHRSNMNIIKSFFKKEGIDLNGRFGEFEYLNMDAVIRHSKDLIQLF